ncbi:MAG: hypothetical protein ABEK59_03645 [Halobacteria archaeon]
MDTETKIQELRRNREKVEGYKEPGLEESIELYRELADYMDRYREEAVGRENFEAYLEFQSLVAEIEEKLEENRDELYKPGKIERVVNIFEKRKLDESHFEKAEDILSELREIVETRDRVDKLEKQLDRRMNKLRNRKKKLEVEVNRREKKIESIENAPDADPEELVELIEEYNEDVKTEYIEFRDSSPVTDVIDLCRKTATKSLVPSPDFTARDVSNLEKTGLGNAEVDTVLQYMGYTDSKLSHYLEGVTNLEFRRAVPTEFLEGFDGYGYQIDPGLEDHPGELEHRISQITSCIDEFASPETVGKLRRIKKEVARNGYVEKKRALKAKGNTEKDTREIEKEIENRKDEIQEIKAEISRIQEAL